MLTTVAREQSMTEHDWGLRDVDVRLSSKFLSFWRKRFQNSAASDKKGGLIFCGEKDAD